MTDSSSCLALSISTTFLSSNETNWFDYWLGLCCFAIWFSVIELASSRCLTVPFSIRRSTLAASTGNILMQLLMSKDILFVCLSKLGRLLANPPTLIFYTFISVAWLLSLFYWSWDSFIFRSRPDACIRLKNFWACDLTYGLLRVPTYFLISFHFFPYRRRPSKNSLCSSSVHLPSLKSLRPASFRTIPSFS